MLQAQVDYWKLQEQIRHDKATEALTSEQNVINRSQVANQADYWRGSLAETHRTNVKHESLDSADVVTRQRQATTAEKQAAAATMQAEASRKNAETNVIQANAAQQQAESALINANANMQNAASNTKRAKAEAQNAETNLMNARTRQNELQLEQQKYRETTAPTQREQAEAAKMQAEAAKRNAETNSARSAWEKEMAEWGLIEDALKSAAPKISIHGNMNSSSMKQLFEDSTERRFTNEQIPKQWKR